MKSQETNMEKGAAQVQEIQTAKKRKRRIWKILGWFFGVILALIVIALLIRDPLIEMAVKKIGTAVTGTKVEVGSFSSSLFKGEVRIKEFVVANPQGYQEPNAFQVSEVFVKIKPGSIIASKFVVHEVLISGTRVNYELKPNGSSNLTDIQNNVKAFAGAPKKEADPKKETKTEKASAKPVEVRLITINDTQILVASSLLKTTIPVPLPPLTITDLDTGSSFGDTLVNFTAEVFAAIGKAISTAGISGENLKAVGDSLVTGGQSAIDAGAGAVKGIKEIFTSGDKK